MAKHKLDFSNSSVQILWSNLANLIWVLSLHPLQRIVNFFTKDDFTLILPKAILHGLFYKLFSKILCKACNLFWGTHIHQCNYHHSVLLFLVKLELFPLCYDSSGIWILIVSEMFRWLRENGHVSFEFKSFIRINYLINFWYALKMK